MGIRRKVVGDMTKVEQHREICERLNHLYAAKNKDYGDSFGDSFQEYGLTMPAIRLDDKLHRFKQLIKQEAEVKDESITDTLMDLANYAIMTIIELENKAQ
ncbi:DUF1599 domain-containing protein [Trichococcus sp. K1Tr]|jgi:hypothetical protein|uniref:DUF1599 domain-containing protein n=1 Tax=Trichococcus sp. K1Tr TaxID=3020847 RepID=UPI002330D5D0|nr:DUF1599 domain-containing protein [Trichococcus sp. K1Tr]MDB6352707.1 DUF1599 domain-containing protein [Trichococcus sp. K1Tr]